MVGTLQLGHNWDVGVSLSMVCYYDSQNVHFWTLNWFDLMNFEGGQTRTNVVVNRSRILGTLLAHF